MKATIKLVLLTALRDRLFIGLFVLLAATSAVAMFFGGTSIAEQLRSAIVFAAAVGRLVLILGLTIFAAFHIQSLFDTREIEAILARSISHTQFVIAYWVGLATVAILIAAAFGFVMVLLAGASGAALAWAVTLVLECAVMLAVVVFSGLKLERATSTVLFAIGFYALARLMGFFVAIRETTTSSFFSDVIKHGLDAVALFIPRLDLFSQTEWLVYGDSRVALTFPVLQSVVFVALVLAASIFDMKRKQF
jgi:hypothetical protein